ncbi:hypothetical protein CRE_24959 [Caenorhabditis remanei]|uniref:Domain of unknown function WSN domain-containing protein n=1 Tax=Caenorhabditis remanei TaxID=31234 RepID=E3MI04_CAERE|nr:hypothetical protein CRE_24959 [Caenorhabditis remanei]
MYLQAILLLLLDVLLTIRCSGDCKSMITISDNDSHVSDTHLRLKGIYQEVAGISRQAKNILLESELSNGNLSPLDVAKQVLNQKLDEKLLEEYGILKLSDVGKHQSEVFSLFREGKKSEISDEMRKDIVDALNVLKGLSGLKTVMEGVDMANVSRDIQKMKDKGDIKLDFVGRYYMDLNKLAEGMFNFMSRMEYLKHDVTVMSTDDLRSSAKLLVQLHLKGANDGIVEFQYLVEGMGLLKEVADPLKLVMTAMGKVNETKILNGLDEKLRQIMKGSELLKKLRDVKMIGLLKTLGSTIDKIEFLKVSEEKSKEYRTNSRRMKVLLDKIRAFSNSMNIIKRKSEYFSNQWKPFEEHTKQLKIPDGQLNNKLIGLQSCNQNFNFTINFSKDETELEAIDDTFSKVRDLDTRFREGWNLLTQLSFNTTIIELDSTLHENPNDTDKIKQIIGGISIDNTFVSWKEYLQRVPLPGNANKEGSLFESIALEIHELLNKVDFDKVQKLTGTIINKLSDFEKQMDCHTQLKIPIDDVVSPMNLLKSTWNFNPQVTLGALDTVLLFQDAYEMIEDIKKWTPDKVNEISEGVKVVDSILKVYENWNEMKDEWDEEEFEQAENSWKFIKNSVLNLVENLSKLESTQAEDLTQFVASIPFPEEFPVDDFKKFIKDDYLGSGRSDILKILEDFQQLKTEFPEFPRRLEKMNRGIGKLREWEKTKRPEEKKPIDCSLTDLKSCKDPITLPAASPLAPLKKVEL